MYLKSNTKRHSHSLLNPQSAYTTAADDTHKYFFHCFSEKIRLDVSSESSARQRIHMKNQALFSLKHKSEKIKCRLLQFLFGALRVNPILLLLITKVNSNAIVSVVMIMCTN